MKRKHERKPYSKPVEKLALSRRGAALSLDRSEGYLRLRELHGDGPPFMRCGRACLYPVDALKEWLSRHSSSHTGHDVV